MDYELVGAHASIAPAAVLGGLQHARIRQVRPSPGPPGSSLRPLRRRPTRAPTARPALTPASGNPDSSSHRIPTRLQLVAAQLPPTSPTCRRPPCSPVWATILAHQLLHVRRLDRPPSAPISSPPFPPHFRGHEKGICPAAIALRTSSHARHSWDVEWTRAIQ
ncbi:hypothetical protein FA95DRAFT_1554052 [Auriscalpium vulgare]|uniref:Uncharacterized protein n=1 Tax=Auriscalpium vulgare TaxID=40419 RepID=A0ACB8S6K2_9AGAM|nr:hypothetical protein FA95DRAFT_1554052 [Auriscalpium vulgare]